MILLSFTILPGPQNISVFNEPSLHNGKVWFCFDPPTCQKVVYWSVGGLFPNQWVYSLNGLDGTNIVSWLNSDPASLYPNETNFASWGWIGSTAVTDSSIIAVFDLPLESEGCVDNEIYNCFNDLRTYFSVAQIESLLDMGIIEQGSVGQLSALCKIKDVLLQLKPSFTPTDVFDYMIVLLNQGLVVSKNPENCTGVMGNVSKFLEYIQANP